MRKLHDKYLHQGHRSFINGKHLSRIEVASWLCRHDEVKVDKHENISNASIILDKYWKEFHQWVNQGIKAGTVVGKARSLSNGSEEARQEKIKVFKALPESVKKAIKQVATNLGVYDKPSAVDFRNFWTSKRGLDKDPKEFTPRVRYSDDLNKFTYKFQQHYEFIIAHNLVEDFRIFMETKRYK